MHNKIYLKYFTYIFTRFLRVLAMHIDIYYSLLSKHCTLFTSIHEKSTMDEIIRILHLDNSLIVMQQADDKLHISRNV